MRPTPRSVCPAALVLLFLVGCESAADRQLDAAMRDSDRMLAEDQRQERQDPRPLSNGYPTVCPVHGTPLRDDVVPIVYGLLVMEPAMREATRTQFPLAKTYVAGGCCVYPPKRQRVKYCPKCRAAESEWGSDRAAASSRVPDEAGAKPADEAKPAHVNN